MTENKMAQVAALFGKKLGEEFRLKEYEIASITSGQNKCNIFLGKRVDNKVFSNIGE